MIVDIVIIGAGLSGLSTAYYLQKSGVHALLLEARTHTGGRIQTIQSPNNHTPLEMGATWFADKHTYLISLVQELKLDIFHQYQQGTGIYETAITEPPHLFTFPENEQPSYRVAGGTSAIINRLAEAIRPEDIILGAQVKQLKENQDSMMVTDTNGNTYQARQVVTTIPPYLLAQQIAFSPSLPDNISHLMHQTHTWMGDSIKFGIEYSTPFWRSKGFSGTILSQAGIATEVYDHTNFEEDKFALKGFLAGGAATLTKEQRETMVVAHLQKLLGKEAGTYLLYTEKVWANDPYTYTPYKNPVFPHQNNGHPLYQQALWNGKLHLSGSETSPYFGGYMDGAVYSGLNAAKNVLQNLANQP